MDREFRVREEAWVSTDTLNVYDLNRIESNTEILREWLLRERNYHIPAQVNNTNWEHEDIPRVMDVTRVSNNIAEIAKHYHQPPDYDWRRLWEIGEEDALGHEDVNLWEQTLQYMFEQYTDGRHFNRHEDLVKYDHVKLSGFTHDDIRKRNDNVRDDNDRRVWPPRVV